MDLGKQQQSRTTQGKEFFDLKKMPIIMVEFVMNQTNWPYIRFSKAFSKTDTFFLIEDRLKSHHGSLKNLQLFYEPITRSNQKIKIQYHFKDTLESKLHLFNLESGQKQLKITLFYRYDNGYQWPLLCS